MTHVDYDSLKPKRKQLVDLILEKIPEVRTTGTVTLVQLRELLGSGIKLPSHPIWIYGDKQFRTETRGVYNVPLRKENLFENPVIMVESILTISEFEAECAAAGIK